MSETPLLALPLIEVAQAQKEVTHNEALIRLDFLVTGRVESMHQAAPPMDAIPGQGWIVASGASGAWAGQDGAIAFFDTGGWRFLMPVAGQALWLADRQMTVRYDGATWVEGEVHGERLVLAGQQVVGARQGAIADPAGGTTVDGQARQALSALLLACRAHGLIET